MGPLAIIVIGGVAYYIYEKQKNPAWSPFAKVFSTPADKVVALEKVKVTSVPTPGPTVALDPHMTTDQVKQVNQTLTTETDPKKIAAHAVASGAAGHTNSAFALAAKANAVGEAKAMGATDVDVHRKQIEAAAQAPAGHAPVPIDAPMPACEAQVLLNVLSHGHADVEGILMPLPITNAFDADTTHMIRVFQSEVQLPATGIMDQATAQRLRETVLGMPAHATPHAPEHVAAWGPALAGATGPQIVGQIVGWDGHEHPWRHGFEHGLWGHPGFERPEHRGFERPFERGFHPHPRPFYGQEMMPPPPPPWRHHRHHHRHPMMMEEMAMQQPMQQPMQEQIMQPMQQAAAQDAGTQDAAASTEAAQGWWPGAGDEYSFFPEQGLHMTPRGEAAYYPPHEPSGGTAFWPMQPTGDYGGYGWIGEGGLGGLGGYGSWGSFGGWGHGL